MKALLEQRKNLDNEIEKQRKKEYKIKLKELVKEYNIPSKYLREIADRVDRNPSIYSN